MAKVICVFCGEEVSTMRGDYIPCGPVYQWACRNCIREVKPLGETDRARRVLQRRFTSKAAAFEEYIAMVDGAEEARPACLRCGEKLKFGEAQALHNNPLNEWKSFFDVLPAYCTNCGKIELYRPEHIEKNKQLSYLVKKDTGEIK